MLKPQPGIMQITPYQGGASLLKGIKDVVKLSSNENPFGPSEAAIQAVKATADKLHRYPSTDHTDLRKAIAEIHKVDFTRVICGVGSDEIITFLCQAYAGPGDEVIHTEHGFAMYRISALASGATPVEVPEKDRFVDVDAILQACTNKTRLVFIANPANPTGTMLVPAEMVRLADKLPDHVLLVVDSAYAEFANGYDGGVSLVEAHENVVMTRTFSKLYGLGGLRVGWGYGSAAVIDTLNRIRGPFNLSVTALAAAEAALRDTAWADTCRNTNAHLRDWLANSIRDCGVDCDPSYANFILARFADQQQAEACDAHLRSQGLIVRNVAGYKLPHCLRITVGDEPGCRRVAQAIGRFMETQP